MWVLILLLSVLVLFSGHHHNRLFIEPLTTLLRGQFSSAARRRGSCRVNYITVSRTPCSLPLDRRAFAEKSRSRRAATRVFAVYPIAYNIPRKLFNYASYVCARNILPEIYTLHACKPHVRFVNLTRGEFNRPRVVNYCSVRGERSRILGRRTVFLDPSSPRPSKTFYLPCTCIKCLYIYIYMHLLIHSCTRPWTEPAATAYIEWQTFWSNGLCPEAVTAQRGVYIAYTHPNGKITSLMFTTEITVSNESLVYHNKMVMHEQTKYYNRPKYGTVYIPELIILFSNNIHPAYDFRWNIFFLLL